MLIKTYSTFRIKYYEDIYLRGLEIDCQERYTHYVYEKQKQIHPSATAAYSLNELLFTGHSRTYQSAHDSHS